MEGGGGFGGDIGFGGGVGSGIYIPTYGGADEVADPTDGAIDDGDPACCVAGTLILTDNGYLPIEKIKQGSLVCGWDYMTADLKEPSFYPVTETFISNTPKKILMLTTSTGKSLTCSMSHPIWLPEYGTFIPASKIDVGENIVLYGACLEDIYHDQVTEINYLLDDQLVYNFTVKEAHTYTANGVLCHNVGAVIGDASDKYTPPPPGEWSPGGGGSDDPGGIPAATSDMGVEWMYGPSVSWVSSPLPEQDSASTPWDETSEYPEGDYTGITLRSADSSLRDGNLESIDPLTAYGMSQDTPEIIAMFDLYATELDVKDTYDSDTSAGVAYPNAHDILFSNGPSKLLRMQIMSGIFLRANINSLFAVFRVQDVNAPSPFSAIDWLAVPASFASLICYMDSVRNQSARLFTAYAAQTSRNMYIKQALQMVKSVKSRSLAHPASVAQSNFNVLRGDASGTSLSTVGTLGLDSVDMGLSGLATLAPYRIQALTVFEDTSFAALASPNTGATLPELFERLQLPNRFKQLSETAVFVQLLQELRRMIIDGTFRMTGSPPSGFMVTRSIDNLMGGGFMIQDDLADSKTAAFVAAIVSADAFINSSASRIDLNDNRLTESGFAGSSGDAIAIGGMIPRSETSGGDVVLGSITSDSLNYQRYGSAHIGGIIDNMPQGYEEALPRDPVEKLTYLCHFMNREFIMSRRWRIEPLDSDWSESGAPAIARKFNSSIDKTTSLSDVLDQVIGDSVGNIAHNGRDIDSFAASLNPEITSTTGGDHVDGRRMLPFELEDGSSYISGYSTYINDLADSFINRESHSDILKADSLATWAAEFGEKQENLSNFVRNLLMIGHVNDSTGGAPVAIHTQSTIVSNHMFLKACCQSLCQFVYKSNMIKEFLLPKDSGADGEYYISPIGFLPERFEQVIQLDIVKVCAGSTEGFNALETYLRYRREAMQLKETGDYDGAPKWPDLGDFSDAKGPSSTSGVDAIKAWGDGTTSEFGGGLKGTSSTTSADGALEEELYDFDTTGTVESTKLIIDDSTYWWEDYYAAFAFAYPRFTQAASDLAYFYIQDRQVSDHDSVIGDTSTSRCATFFADIDAIGQSTTRYGLMQTPIGAALIEAEGESNTGTHMPLFDRMIGTWDLYVESIYTMADAIENSPASASNQFTAANFGRGSKSRYTTNTNTWYRNISLDTCRMLTYYTLTQLISLYVAKRSSSSVWIDGHTNLSAFSVSVSGNTGNVYNSLLDSDKITSDSDGSYIAISGHADSDTWRWEDEAINVSDDSPFNIELRIRYDGVESSSFLMSCINTFGQSFATQVNSTLSLGSASDPAFGSGGYSQYISDMNNYWEASEWTMADFMSNNTNISLGSTSRTTWFDPLVWPQSFSGIPAMAQCLVNEDIMIIRSLNAFSHVKDILNNRTALGQGIGSYSAPGVDDGVLSKSAEYIEYLRKYAFGLANVDPGSIDLDDDDAARLTVKSIFNGMNPDAVASAYAILCDNFTLSTAYINNLSSLPTPFQKLTDISFDDGSTETPGTATKSYPHLIPASETTSEANYAAIRWFQAGDKNKTLTSTDQTTGDLDINKKIIVVGIPTGMLESLREKARIDELVYREAAFSTSNFAHSSLIRIRIIKKSHDNPDIVFTPRTFYFDTKYYYTDSGTSLNPITLYKDTTTDTVTGDADAQSISSIKDLTPDDSYAGIKNLLGVYSESQSAPVITDNPTLESIRSRLPGDAIYTTQTRKIARMGIEKRPQDYGTDGMGLANLVNDPAEPYKTFNDSGIKLVRFELSATADINSSRNNYTYEFDYDVDTHTPGDAATYIESAYRDVIMGGHDSSDYDASSDPTLDFFGLDDSSGDIGESVDGLFYDPWAYDQRSGEHFTVAFGAMSDPRGRHFGYQAAFNEVYSGILKHYIKMMTGFNVSERCFLNQTSFGAPMVQSPTSLFTEKQNTYLGTIRKPELFGDTDLTTRDLGFTSEGKPEAAINAAKITVISQAVNYLRVAGAAISSLELQSLVTMMYKTLPISADKFRNQGLLPKKFDRIFCIAIDPEADFTPYYAASDPGVEEHLGIEGFDGYHTVDLEDATVTGAGSDGLLYSFLVDVAIIPMDSEASLTRAQSSGEDIIG